MEQLYEAMLPNLPQYVVSLALAGEIGGLNILPLLGDLSYRNILRYFEMFSYSLQFP